MNVFACDTETTTSNKGNPYDKTNKLVCASWSTDGTGHARPWDDSLRASFQAWIDKCDWLVLFNAKFDIAWLRRVGIRFDNARVWDCQLAEFLLSNQTLKYPSLEGAATKYGLGHKIDIIKTEYWAKKIDTDAIPWDILSEYAAQDAALTYKVFEQQYKLLQGNQRRLFLLQCQDLLILQEMEWNGLKYDVNLCNKRAGELEGEINELYSELSSIYPNVPINFGSNDQLSAFLYGGTVEEETRELVGFFKTGKKLGEPRYKVNVQEHVLPRIYTPLKGSEMAKEGVFSTSEDTLKKLKGKKDVVDKLLALSKLEKLNSTYYKGLHQKNLDRNWEEGTLHGQFNQCVAVSGRLSSSDPNLQNMAEEVNQIFVTRYR